MEEELVQQAILSATLLSGAIVLLGVVYLLILRTPGFQFNLRFFLLALGCFTVALGLWTALLRERLPISPPAEAPAEQQAPEMFP